MEKHITVPFDKDTVKELKVGDYVYLTGTIYTARDAAHKRMYEALQKGEELPFAVGYNYNRLLNFKGEWKGSKEEEYYFSLVNKCKSVDIKDYPKVYPEYFK